MIERMAELDRLKADLSAAVDEGVQTGNLERANQLRSQIEDRLVEVKNSLCPYPSFPVIVDYNQDPKELIKKSPYPIYHSGFNLDSLVNTPAFNEGICHLKIHILKFKHQILTETVLKHMNRYGLQPASIYELLVLDPDLPLLSNLPEYEGIVALGSSVASVSHKPFANELIPTLDKGGTTEYSIRFVRDIGPWPTDWLFAAVKKLR